MIRGQKYTNNSDDCLSEQAAEIKYAVEENFKQDLKWDLPQHFRSKVSKSNSSQPRHRVRPRAASLTCSCAVEQFSAFISEQAASLPGPQVAARRLHRRSSSLQTPDSVSVARVRVKEAKVARTPSPKYFCKSCRASLCGDCFKAACISHDVQWRGNKYFRCTISLHCRQ